LAPRRRPRRRLAREASRPASLEAAERLLGIPGTGAPRKNGLSSRRAQIHSRSAQAQPRKARCHLAAQLHHEAQERAGTFHLLRPDPPARLGPTPRHPPDRPLGISKAAKRRPRLTNRGKGV